MANLEFVNQRLAVGSLEVVGAQGPVLVKRIEYTAILAALTSASVTLATFNPGDTIIDVMVVPTTAVGAACTVDIGVDATFDGASGDADAFINDADLNATTAVRMTTATPTAGIAGAKCAADGGAVKIISSANRSATTAFRGYIDIVYIASTKTSY